MDTVLQDILELSKNRIYDEYVVHRNIYFELKLLPETLSRGLSWASLE